MRADKEPMFEAPSLEERAANWLADPAIAAAVKAEREACALIADDAAMFLSVRGKGAWAGVAKAIADEIRKRAQ
jgi:hypothetical protein